MHFHLELYLKEEPKDLELAIKEAMAPFYQYDENGDFRKGIWDWYQIGGRWKGVHVPDYDPEKDPENFNEKGEVSWPTRWGIHEKDIIDIKEVAQDLKAAMLLVNGEIYEKKMDSFSVSVIETLKSLGITEGYLVTIDCHI